MKLITFDKSKNISYFGECKLQFNGPDKCLYIKLLDKDPEEILTDTFDRIFISKNNLLCSMNRNSKNALILVFSTKEKCERIFNAILKVKSRYSLFNDTVAINEDEVFKDNFYLPLVKASESGINGFDDLKTIIQDFVDSLEAEDRILYFNNQNENLLIQSPIDNVDLKNDKMIVNPQTCSRSLRIRKRSNISYKENDDDEEDENGEIPRKRPKVSRSQRSSWNISNLSCFDVPSPKNSSDDVIFDIVECHGNEKMEKKLLVFTSNERKQCYEFCFNQIPSNFRCIKCSNQKQHTVIKTKHTIIKSTIHSDGSKTFNFDCGEHICHPIDYVPENYQSSLIIKSPNFKMDKHKTQGKIHPLLIILSSDDKNMCYRFGFDCIHYFYYCCTCKRQGQLNTARFIQHEGKTAVELNRLEHLCKPVKYIPYKE